jgi:hypothetical protein
VKKNVKAYLVLRIGEEVVVDFGERYKTMMKTWGEAL